jgi:hypothetical protein
MTILLVLDRIGPRRVGPPSRGCGRVSTTGSGQSNHSDVSVRIPSEPDGTLDGPAREAEVAEAVIVQRLELVDHPS